MDFFLEGKTEVGLSCECGDFYKIFEFGYLNLRATNYIQFMDVIGFKLEQSIIDEWNQYGYRAKKIKSKTKQESIFDFNV